MILHESQRFFTDAWTFTLIPLFAPPCDRSSSAGRFRHNTPPTCVQGRELHSNPLTWEQPHDSQAQPSANMGQHISTIVERHPEDRVRQAFDDRSQECLASRAHRQPPIAREQRACDDLPFGTTATIDEYTTA